MKRPKARKSIIFDYRKKQRIDKIFHDISSEKGRESAHKVFQVLEGWQKSGLILSYEEAKKWGYKDYILHEDGFFVSLEAETVVFQIVSSAGNAREHLARHPGIPVIVVEAGISIDVLNKKMEELFKDKLPQTVGIM